MSRIFHAAADGTLPPRAAEEFADAVRAGRIVVFPTDTVYGIGCDGFRHDSRHKIYEIKGRDSRKPLPILVHSIEDAWRWTVPSPAARTLAARFWPGPLTLVLTPTDAGKALTDGPTLAVRVPAHGLLRELIRASGVPWASTSANRSGSPAIADGAAAVAEFSDSADCVLSAGSAGGAESSVVDAREDAPRILREGALPRGRILDALGA